MYPSEIKKYLKKALDADLPAAASHQKMLPPGRRLTSLENELSLVKQSSVLLLIFPDGDRLFTCLMKRPVTMKHHPGQISLPGGQLEKEDISAQMAALREAREEVGIDPNEIEMLGKLSDLYVEVSRFSIQPFIAWADKKPEFMLNSGEAERLIFFPISDFVENELISETLIDTLTGSLTIRYYPLDGEIIWGATAMILSELIDILKNHFSQTAN